jgi:hypothetical protein
MSAQVQLNMADPILDDVIDLAKRHTRLCVDRLAYYVENYNDYEAKVVITAANSLLDRGHGRPMQALSGPEGGALTVRIVKFGEE